MRDLTERTWPVYYYNANSPSMLTYNIGHYLVPALLSKFFNNSFRAAENIMLIWTVIGILLILLNIFLIVKAKNYKEQFVSILIFIFWNGCLFLAQQLFDTISGIESTDIKWMTQIDDTLLQYKSTLVCLCWVMPQTITCWLVVTLWWSNRSKIQDYVGLMIPTMLSGVNPFCGLVFMAIICSFVECFKQGQIRKTVKNIFSVQNIIASFVIGGILLLYYAGNAFSSKPNEIAFRLYMPNLKLYLCFIFAEFGIYSLLLLRDEFSNGLFIGASFLLLILPFLHMGKFNDLVICGNIPAMFVIMLASIKYIISHSNETKKGILIALIAISSIYPIKEIRAPVYHLNLLEQKHNVSLKSLELWSDLTIKHNDLKYNYFTYDVKNNWFINYFASKGWKDND